MEQIAVPPNVSSRKEQMHNMPVGLCKTLTLDCLQIRPYTPCVWFGGADAEEHCGIFFNEVQLNLSCVHGNVCFPSLAFHLNRDKLTIKADLQITSNISASFGNWIRRAVGIHSGKLNRPGSQSNTEPEETFQPILGVIS